MIELWFAMAMFSAALIISPGPGNALLAANGASFGYRRTLGFLLGFEAANLILSLAYGFGLVNIFDIYPLLFNIFKIAGSLYIFYLAYTFFVAPAKAQHEDAKPMGFMDGLIVVMLNPKIHTMFPLVYSQFLDPMESVNFQVFVLTGIFVFLCVICHSVWILGGDFINRKFQSEKFLLMQNIVFGTTIALVGVYILVT